MKTVSGPFGHLLKAIGAVIVATASSANAQEATPFDHSTLPSTRSRAEVNAEVKQARANGTPIASGEVTEFAISPSTLSRAQVVAEAIEARRLGLIAHGELNPPVPTPEQQRMIADAGRRAVERQDHASR